MDELQDLFIAYGLLDKQCNEPLHSKKLCPDNPLCLHGYGLKFWLADLHLTPVNEEISFKEAAQGEPHSLKNVSTNCYCNSCVQVLYYLPQFRKTLYELSSTQPSETADCTGILENLQLLFAQLQLAKQKVVDPNSFVKCLNLPDSDQDCHEFFNLCLEKLDEETALLSHDALTELFRGENYVIRSCTQCGFQSSNQCDTYLQLLLHSQKPNLVECIADYFEPQPTDHKCPVENCEGFIATCTKPSRLPRVLCLLLPRLTFNPATLSRKKSFHVCHLPEYLDMKTFLSPSQVTSMEADGEHDGKYVLKAVVAHLGQKSHEGHYVCSIRLNEESWLICNDEKVKTIPHEKFVMQKEFDAANKLKKAKAVTNQDGESLDVIQTPEGRIYPSSDAYFVFYTLNTKDSLSQADVSVPNHLQETVEAIQKDFELTLHIQLEERRVANERTSQLHETMRSICQKLIVTPETIKDIIAHHDGHYESIEAVPKEWLKRCLHRCKDGSVRLPCPLSSIAAWELSPSSLFPLCAHKKLALPTRSHRVVRTEGVEMLLRVCESPHESSDVDGCRFFIPHALCQLCIQDQIEFRVFRQNLENEKQRLQLLLDEKESSETEYYWLSKKSFNTWTKKAESTYIAQHSNKESPSADPSEDDLPHCGFNREYLCQHGKFKAKVQDLIAVPEIVWNSLLTYFPSPPDVPTFPVSLFPVVDNQVKEECSGCQCVSEELDARAKREEGLLPSLTSILRQSRKNNRDVVENVLCDKTNCLYVQEEELSSFQGEMYYLVPGGFVKAWRLFQKNPSTKSLPSRIDYSKEICEHNLLSSPIVVDSGTNLFKWLIVSECEWNALKPYRECLNGFSLKILRLTTPFSSENDPSIEWVIGLEICAECEARRATEFTVYIRQIEGPIDQKTMPDLLSLPLSNGQESIPKQTDLRRSKRKRREPNDFGIVVKRTDSLTSLKLKIMQEYGVFPMDQHLVLLNDPTCTELKEGSNTLNSFNMDAGDVLLLWADKNQPLSDEDTCHNSETKAGFSGTKLSKCPKLL